MVGIDFAFWGFILGAVGTIVSSALALLQLIERVKAKSREREELVEVILKAVLGPLRSLAQSFANENAYPGMIVFLNSFRVYKDEILGSQPVLSKLVPHISLELVRLIDIIEKETNGSWELTPSIVDGTKLKVLVGHLGIKIEKWLSDRV